MSDSPTYTADWFSIFIPKWTEWLAKFRSKTHLRFLEIGCYEGRATRWLLDNILTDDTSVIMVVDTFEGSIEMKGRKELRLNTLYDRFMHNIAGYDRKVRVLKGESQWLLRTIVDPIDFVYIDGSHMASDVLEDAVLSFRLLKPGGRLIFDDYSWHLCEDELLKPRLGIDAFLSVFKDQYRHVEPPTSDAAQVCIEKSEKFSNSPIFSKGGTLDEKSVASRFSTGELNVRLRPVLL